MFLPTRAAPQSPHPTFPPHPTQLPLGGAPEAPPAKQKTEESDEALGLGYEALGLGCEGLGLGCEAFGLG